MKKIKTLFAQHPSEAGETYGQHFKAAFGVAFRLQTAAIAQFLHAIFPFIAPPCGRDICSTIEYLEKKTPEYRKRCNDKISNS